jgi:hypothetical protein
MSDHTWTQEHAAAYVAGGLSAEEAERLEAHVRDCPACAAAVAAARDLDRGLGELFAAGRPGPALEDRAVWSFRTGRRRWKVLSGWPTRLAAGVAATVGLAVTGYAVSRLGGPDGLKAPGESLTIAWLNDERNVAGRQQVKISNVDGLDIVPDQQLTNEDMGLQSDLPALAQANQSNKHELDKLVTAAASADAQAARLQATLNATVMELDAGRARNNKLEALQQELTITREQAGRNGLAARLYSEGMATQDILGVPNSGKVNIKGLAPPGLTQPWFNETAKPDPVAITDGTSNNLYLGYTHILQPQLGNTNSPGDSNALWGLSIQGRTAAFNFQPHFFNPATARPALPTPGRPATGEGKENSGQKPEPGKPPPANAGQPAQPDKPAPPANPEPGARRVVIRSGDIEFEVDSFDSAVATVTKLVRAINGGFVATVNSEKLPNGKVKGAVTVRVPPEHLDELVLDLRKELGKAGELKGQKIGSSDITKQYTDLESRLKAARTMEQRLLQIIKEGKGDIKSLLEAEKELGVWRTKIEEIEGELRYYSNLAALSTLTVTLTEKEIRAAVGITESERVQAGVEVEDVDKAYQEALAAVIEAKGRVTKSELKQLAAGQFNATLHFEVAPEAAGPMRDRLRQLGRVARLEIDRLQQAEGGTVPKDAKVKRGDTVFLVQLYNLANVAPRETATIHVAATDVSAAYSALRDAVAKAGGRVMAAQLNESDRQNVSAQVDFEVKRAHDAEVRAALDGAGEVVSRQVTRAPESDSVTDTKVLYRATLLSAARLKPREVTTLAVEVEDVNATVAVYGAQVAEVKGRQVDSQSAHESNGRMTARVTYEVPLAAASGLVEKFKTAGVVRVYQSARDPYVPDTRFATARLEVTVSNADRIIGRDAGVWPQVRRGLSYSASVLLTSLTWVVFGLCVVLPWAVVGYGGYRVVRRVARGPAAPATPQAPAV